MKLLWVICALLWVSQASAIDIQQWQTKNGARVLFVETHDLPMIDIRMTFKAGSSRDGQLPGVSRLVNALIVDGTGDKNAEDIALQMESAGAELGHNSLKDMAWSSLRILSQLPNRADIIDLYARVTALPSFPKDALERDRVSMLTSLKSRQTKIANVTADAFNQALYKGHVYETGSQGTERGLKAIQQSDLFAFHQQYYVAKNATLAIVGDLTLVQAKQVAEQITRYLKAGEAAEAIAAPKVTDAKTRFIDFDSTQTHIVLGLPVLARKDDDFYALYVGNHIFGGSGFGSRLMNVIREEKGLSYSVYSYFAPMESNGPFEMAMQTANHQVNEARGLLKKLLEEFITTGPTKQELIKAQKNITGGFALKIDSNKKITDYLAVIGFYDLPLSYLDDFNDKVNAVTIQAIQDAFKRRVKMDQMIEIVVGPKAGNG